jgi:Tfp pilus assembly protein PilP
MRWLSLLLLLLAACSKGADADLASIGEARSLTAEWALVNEQAADGKVTHTYADTMREQLRDQLQSTSSALTQPNSRYGNEIGAVLRLPDDAAPPLLRLHAATLKQIEDHLEST